MKPIVVIPGSRFRLIFAEQPITLVFVGFGNTSSTELMFRDLQQNDVNMSASMFIQSLLNGGQILKPLPSRHP